LNRMYVSGRPVKVILTALIFISCLIKVIGTG
jgi:hypothetical protein